MLDVTQYRDRVLAEIDNIHAPTSIASAELKESYKNAKAIENILLPVFNNSKGQDIELTDQNRNQGVDNILAEFRRRVLEILEQKKIAF